MHHGDDQPARRGATQPPAQATKQSTGRSALRVSDSVTEPAGGLGSSRLRGRAKRPGIRYDGAPFSVVLAGGGTAGHIEPAMAVADALTALDPRVRITALGTARGLEIRLVPERGYDLELITPVPLPRKPNSRPGPTAVAGAPGRSARPAAVLDGVDADVVIGFGGYVALPAYLAARGGPLGRRRIPVVIHEANARAGIANKVGARTAQRVLAAVPDSGLRCRGGRQCRCAPPSPTWTGGVACAGAGPFRIRRGCQGAAGLRRLPGRASINRAVSSAAAELAGQKYLRAACARTEERAGSAHPVARRSALCRRAVPGPDGPCLRGGRSGDLPLRGDDGRRGVGGRAARGVRAAADRQRRTTSQRAAGGQCRWRSVGRRRRSDPRRSSPTPSAGCSPTRRDWPR